jgi:hypothetical protein
MMGRARLVAPGVVMAWFAAAAAAFGQGGAAGSITGHVYDQSGNPLPGVKITAESPTQIGGARTTYSNGEGFFRFPALFPGKFQLRATAPKLETYYQRDIPVGITSAVDLDIMMEVAGKTDIVKVVERVPIISPSTSNVKEVYDLDFVESLPMTARDQVHTQMINEVAGANNGRMRGGSSSQTMFTQDGFELNASNGTYPVLLSSAAYEVNTAGYGADAPTSPGGIINLVTRSGSNRTELQLNATVDIDQLRLFRDSRDVAPSGIGPQGAGASSYYIVAPMLAGPIVKDRLWYFVTDEVHFIERTRTADPDGFFPERLPYRKFIHKGTLKLTWQMTPRNKLSWLTNLEWPISEQNQRPEFGVEDQAQRWRIGRRMFTGLIWESVLRDTLVMRAQAGVISLWSHVYPVLCRDDPGACDHVPSYRQLGTAQFPREQWYGNDNQHARDDLFAVQSLAQLEWYPGRRLLGEHNVTFRHRYYTEHNGQYRSVPGDQVTELSGTLPSARTTYYANDPRYEEPRYGWSISEAGLDKSTTTLSDSWKTARGLTLTPSLSHVWARGGNSRGDTVISSSSWVPGLAAAWDATGDGRTVIRGAASSYVDIDLLDVARHTAGGQVSRRCRWNEADPVNPVFDRECTFSGGNTNTFGSPCGPTGMNPDGTSCRQPLRLPRTHEYTLGGEREVITALALSLDFVYRRFVHQFDRRETNRIWDTSGSQLDALASFRNGRPETIVDMSTPDSAWREYQGITAGLAKREGRFKSHVSYTLARLTGTQQDLNNLYGDIPARDVFLDGYLPDDHRHEVKWTASWQAVSWLSFGLRYKYLSGQPYNRLFFNRVTNSWDLYRADTGVNPGPNINDPGDDRELRLPDRHDLNLQGRLSLGPLIGHRIDLYVDVLNVMGLRTATAIGQEESRNFGTETAWMDPFRIRLGLNYRY